MEIGRKWQVLNIGVRFRQRRTGTWTTPSTYGGARRIGFGLCSGTTNPFGSGTADNFIGLSTRANWTRAGVGNWWQTGWRMFTVDDITETQQATGTEAYLRVSEQDMLATAWYLRLTRLTGENLRAEWFVPDGIGCPDEMDFLNQLDREIWQTNVNKHGNYKQFSLELNGNESTRGYLDTVNIFSELHNFETAQLGGAEFVSVRALVIR